MSARSSIALRPHDLVRVGLTVRSVGGNPSNLQTPWGVFHRVWVRSGDVWHARARGTTPPFELTRAVTATGRESEPRLGYELGRSVERLWLLYTHTQDSATWVYEQFSDTDGDDWSAPAVVASMAKHPEHCFDHHVGRFRIHYEGGLLVCTEFQAGVQVATFTLVQVGGAPLRVSDDSYRISYATEGAERPVLTVIIDGESEPSEWVSGDDLRTWERVSG